MEYLREKGLDIMLSCLAILLGVRPIMIVIGILLFFDLLTGIWCALRNGEEISSKKLRNSISKMIVYQIAILSAFLVERFIIPHLPLTEIVAGFLSLVELKSISENIFKISGINFFDGIKKYLNKEGSKIGIEKETVETISEIIEENHEKTKQKES